METIADNINFIKNKINSAANGREVKLIAVTKTFSADCVKEALECDITDIAESKIQEALPKFDILKDKLNDICKHFIGHLQSNKAKKAVLNFDLIQSLDSIDLAKDINRHAEDVNKIQKCLIELKVSDEETKKGACEDKVFEIYKYCTQNCNHFLIFLKR